jgi:hypothetical protein
MKDCSGLRIENKMLQGESSLTLIYLIYLSTGGRVFFWGGGSPDLVREACWHYHKKYLYYC